jgi:DUF971 family protein
MTRWGVGTEHELDVALFEGVSPSSNVRGVVSSQRRSVPRCLAMKSKLLKRKA